MSPSRSKRGSINLTALGSAAVIAVYSAGYLRTKAAAQRFESGQFDRRPVPPRASTVAIIADSTSRPDSTSRADGPLVAQPTTQVAAPAAAKAKAKAKVDQPTTSARDTSTAADSVASAAPVASPIQAPSPAPVDSAKAVSDSLKPMKDGTYKGWGTSRHGDIEAAVEIKAGRIVNAYITQCLTRYSCDRIAIIIPQVVARQSAEVDFVSGATQSTNAFYYAILEALSKAK
jgi:uncharacterized protein with FMN-binding domain